MSGLVKSPFFDFLNRHPGLDFETFQFTMEEDRDFIDWNGYLLPMNYGDEQLEYRAIRESCALFDVTPLRKCWIRGSQAGLFLDRLCTRPVSSATPMRGIYVVFCNEKGHLKDDAILHKIAEDEYLLLPSDTDHRPYFRQRVTEWGLNDVQFDDCTPDWAAFAVQGPGSAAALSAMGIAGIEQLRPFELKDYPLGKGMIRIARMGFTGDLGYECWIRPEQASEITQRITEARVSTGLAMPGYGLGALDSCRLEGGFIVAGWDCSTDIDSQPGFERSPLELGLGWMVKLDGGDFVGKEALQKQASEGYRWHQRSILLNSEDLPEEGTDLFIREKGSEQVIGRINCVARSGFLGCVIGNSCIEDTHAGLGQAQARVNGQIIDVEIRMPPLLKRDYARHTPAPMTLKA